MPEASSAVDDVAKFLMLVHLNSWSLVWFYTPVCGCACAPLILVLARLIVAVASTPVCGCACASLNLVLARLNVVVAFKNFCVPCVCYEVAFVSKC